MDAITLNPERRLPLEEYARRRDQDLAAALDDALATYLEWERQDYADTLEAVLEGYQEAKAGRAQPSGAFLEELRVKHGLSR